MKTKTSYFIPVLLGLLVIFGLYTLAIKTPPQPIYPLTENEAVGAVISQYPELSVYKGTDLPPSSIKTQNDTQGWYVAFIREGSGVPGIIDAKCYHVGNQRDIAFISEYKKANGEIATSINLQTCEPVITPSIPVVTDNGLKIGETQNFGSTSIKPLSVEEDSRCPTNANCIWAGRVRVKVQINGNVSIVTLGQEFPIDGVVVTLTDVLPQKTGGPIAASDYRFTFTVTKQNATVPNNTAGKCYVGGCSGQICSDKPDAISTCEYTESYACYKTAKCERQASGQCGWTETEGLRGCLGR